jgi:hypothetical protein
MSEVTFLNHSCLIAKDEGIRILCDPWFFGTAFQEGWSLLEENTHDINEINFDYIWISHEHPDHFSIATLLSLKTPATFLYQFTLDKKVKNFLEKKGHQVIELEDSKTIELHQLKLTLFVCDGYDSSLLFEFSDGTFFLNVNDARIDLPQELSRVKDKIKGQTIDLIASQFSYANWAGNRGDIELPKHQQKLVNDKNILLIEALKPKKFLLFASYVFYSHEENFFWNKPTDISEISEHLSQIDEQCSVIIPVPNQVISLNQSTNTNCRKLNAHAIQYWNNLLDQRAIATNTLKPPSQNVLIESYQTFYKKLWNQNAIENIQNNADHNFHLTLFIQDLNQVIQIDLFKESFKILKSNHPYDCKLSAEVFLFLMNNLFARGTVVINSRIEFNYLYAYKFFIFFFVPYANNIGRSYLDKKLQRSDLRSIRNTSVLSSIFYSYPEAEANLEKDLLLF